MTLGRALKSGSIMAWNFELAKGYLYSKDNPSLWASTNPTFQAVMICMIWWSTSEKIGFCIVQSKRLSPTLSHWKVSWVDFQRISDERGFCDLTTQAHL